MFSAARKPCAGFNQPCGTPIPLCNSLCEDCDRRRAQQDAAVALWASRGIHQLEQYLTGWAAFAAWLTLHGKE